MSERIQGNVSPASDPERRQKRRRSVRMLVDYVSRQGVRCEYATTLGEGGLFVETETPLPAGAPLRLRFRLPGSARVHEVEGRVAWVREPATERDDAYPPGMGIRFTDSVAEAGVARELEDLLD